MPGRATTSIETVYGENRAIEAAQRAVSSPLLEDMCGNECTDESCDIATGCISRNVDDGVSCNGGVGECQSGACVALPWTDRVLPGHSAAPARR